MGKVDGDVEALNGSGKLLPSSKCIKDCFGT